MAQATTAKKTNVQVLVDDKLWAHIASYGLAAGLADNSAALEAVLAEFFKDWVFGPRRPKGAA